MSKLEMTLKVACLRSATKSVGLVFALWMIGLLLGAQSAYAQVYADPLYVDSNGHNAGALEHAIIFPAPISFLSFAGLGHPPSSFTVKNGVGIASSRSGLNNGGLDFYTPGVPGTIPVPGATAQIQVSITPGGEVGIGTQTPSAPLEIDRGGYAQINLNSTTGRNWALMSTGANVSNASNFQIYDLTAKTSRMQIDATGLVSVDVLRITGGSDLAEPFRVTGPRVEPGWVMVIDDVHAGELRPSTSEYDRKVAGVVSGAGGIHAALTLTQAAETGGREAGSERMRNVALSGRVYVMADATEAPIEPGDLLTTSNTPGHCMKAVDHGRAEGAILGKAMSPLKGGKGLVLALVTLE